MATWLKDRFLDFFIGNDSPDLLPLPSTRPKRRTSTDGRRPARSKRCSAEAYRDAPYGSAGPSRSPPYMSDRRRNSVRTRRILKGLRRNLPSDTNTQTEGLFAQLKGQLEYETGKPVRRLNLTGLGPEMEEEEEELLSLDGSDGIFPDDEELGWLPKVTRKVSEESVGWEPESKKHPSKIETYLRRPSRQAGAPKVSTAAPVVPESSSTRRPPVAAKPAVPPSNSRRPVAEEPWVTNAVVPEIWSTKPNDCAREILQNHPLTAKQLIQREIQEPEYALRDAEIRDGLWKLMDHMERLTKPHFSFAMRNLSTREALLRKCFKSLSPQTAKIIGCVASGGPGGVAGWEETFYNQDVRPALVLAIVGNVLVEQVFQHMFFGGSKEQIDALAKMQEDHRDEDCFDRNTHYATFIRSIIAPSFSSHSRAHTLPPNFSNHVNYTTSVLWTHLSPLFLLQDPKWRAATPLPALKEIVTLAGLLSLTMRLDAHTVYHFEPVFKEDTFNAKRMECYNQCEMQQSNPRTPDDKPLLSDVAKLHRAKIPAAEKQRSKNDDPLTRITLMDGLTAYRLGGWEKPQSSLVSTQFEKIGYSDMDVRSRIITYGWVYCRWGRARKFKDGKPADVPEAHGAVWKNGGFVEFTDVTGVVDWLAVEREKKGREREGRERSAKGKGRAVEVEVRETRSGTRGSRRDSVAGPPSRPEMSEEEAVDAQLASEMGAR